MIWAATSPFTREPGPESVQAREVRVHIRGVKAVDGVDLTLAPGRDPRASSGPNGAGKTTLVNVLSGFQRATAGRVVLNGDDITTWAPAEIARAGLVRTFQDVRLFPGLTVFENVEAGAVSTGRPRRQARAARRGELLARLRLEHARRSARRRAASRRASAARDRPRARRAALVPAAGRAGRRAQRGRVGRPRRRARGDQGRVRRRPARDRARHAPDHAALRADPGARPRQDDRGGHAGADPERSGGARGVSRERGRRDAQRP